MTEIIVGSICTPEEFDDNLKIDFSKYTRKKGSIDYVPWAELVRTLHKKIPGCTYGFKETAEGSMIFYTPEKNAYLRPYLTRIFYSMTADGCRRVVQIIESPPGFFPISNMRSRHAAIASPNIRDIDNCLRRAIAKEIGVMTGIGLQLWAADDPYDLVDEEEPCVEPKATRGATSSSTGSSGSKTSASKAAPATSSPNGAATTPDPSAKPLAPSEKLDQAASAAGLTDHGKQTVAVAVKSDSWTYIPTEKMPKIIALLGNKDHVKLFNDGRNTSGKVINPRDRAEEMRELAAAFREPES